MTALAPIPPICRQPPDCSRSHKRLHLARPESAADPMPLDPWKEPEDPIDPMEPDEIELPCTDDADWEVFIADDDRDPLPEPGDFWIDDPEE